MAPMTTARDFQFPRNGLRRAREYQDSAVPVTDHAFHPFRPVTGRLTAGGSAATAAKPTASAAAAG